MYMGIVLLMEGTGDGPNAPKDRPTGWRPPPDAPNDQLEEQKLRRHALVDAYLNHNEVSNAE